MIGIKKMGNHTDHIFHYTPGKGAIKPVVFAMICLLFIIVLPSVGCRKETEEDKVRKIITDIQKSAEEKDTKNIINNLSESYNDLQGFNRDTVKGLLFAYFLRHPKISIYINNLKITIEDESSEVTFQAILTGGSKTGSVSDIVPKSLGVYNFSVSLKKESKGWKVISAKWEQVGEER